MESEAEVEPYSTTQLPLLLPSSHSPDPPGMRTPPLYTMASVPFRWEEEPGKPRPCTALIPFPTTTEPKSLELPPSRLLLEPPPKITYKTLSPSPTTVLEGPYCTAARPTNKFTSASFRFFREHQGSFDSTASTCTSPEKGPLSAAILAQKLHKGRAFFGSWRQRTPKPCSGKKEVTAAAGSSSFVHPSSSVDAASLWSDEGSNKRVKITKIRRNGSFSSLSQARPHFWAAVYEGFKQVIPWKSRKSKKESIV